MIWLFGTHSGTYLKQIVDIDHGTMPTLLLIGFNTAQLGSS